MPGAHPRAPRSRSRRSPPSPMSSCSATRRCSSSSSWCSSACRRCSASASRPIEAGLITLQHQHRRVHDGHRPGGAWRRCRAANGRPPAPSGSATSPRMRHVVLPQAVRAMIPPTVSLAVGQLQVSSLISMIGVVDLTKVGTNLNIRTLAPFTIWPIVGARYFVVSKPLSMLAAWTESRLERLSRPSASARMTSDDRDRATSASRSARSRSSRRFRYLSPMAR